MTWQIKEYKIIKCHICGNEYKSNGFNRHLKYSHGQEELEKYKSFKLQEAENNIKYEVLEEDKIKCLMCGEVGTNFAIKFHIFCHHTEKGKEFLLGCKNRIKSTPAWNKGLTKETDERLVKSGKTYSDRVKSGIIIPHFTGKTHTIESCQQISEKLSINNRGGRCKWYEVDGVNVQGTWERDIAIKLKELGITWIKSKKKEYTLKYEINGKIRNYTPDFYLPDYDVWLEIKGFWWGNDKEKMRIVKEQHPEKNIRIIEKEDFERILRGELVW